ncbi:hypothetical protein N0V83_007094 [Neocucurbitaria cava]|uniref:F-box domain-containing protein n=1 Tax=Neocucurbitaria cava TaxID=798079 RepID=A0A9W8Y4V4_9PLEO|nr:hypothetical protein N0V83_007094 [Neocucurbitaria cava]
MAPQLDSLPPEILFNILSFTEPTCNPALVSYPLNALAETSKHLNTIVEEYARSLLKQHANITPPKNSRVFTCRRKWLGEICQFCKKPSKRRAILYGTLTCCRTCDKAQFPKMTMTKATQDHALSKLDLFTPNALHPHLAPLSIGNYTVMGGTATMILAADVVARRDHIYAVLGNTRALDAAYMRKRVAAHQRMIQHMGIVWDCEDAAWREAYEPRVKEMVTVKQKGPKSMRSEDSRREYVKMALTKEWDDMGVREGGGTKDTAIEID